jgi:hypothetical protein
MPAALKVRGRFKVAEIKIGMKRHGVGIDAS